MEQHSSVNSIRQRLFSIVENSFPRAWLSENCSLLGTDNVRGQISEHVFAPNGGYCLYILVHNFVCRGEKRQNKDRFRTAFLQ